MAITLHERQLSLRPFVDYAADRGITLIPGIERTIEGCHVVLLNFTPATEWVNTFADLRGLKAREPQGLVIAPHAFFPIGVALGDMLDRHTDLFDVVERNAMFTRVVDFNQKAERWARAHGKPMVGNGDVHRLCQLGSTYSIVDAPPDAGAICEAVRKGRVEVHAEPLSVFTAATLLWDLMAKDLMKAMLRPAPAAHL